jgi:hypothetical protein
MEQSQEINLPKRIIVCGDSFNIGIGCWDLTTQPYGSLLAKHLNIPLINLAKGSSTNLSIWLQVKYAFENLNAGPDDLILVNETSSERINWFPDGYEHNHEITNLDVNYHQYPPYGPNSYHQILPQHPMQNDPGYKGKMITENMRGVVDYIDNFVDNGIDQHGSYYSRLAEEPVQRVKLVKDFYLTVYDESISQIQSRALMTMCHVYLKNKNARHLMLLPYPGMYINLMDESNTVQVDWGQLAVKYPDQIPSGHADERGHIEVFNTVLTKLKFNGWA